MRLEYGRDPFAIPPEDELLHGACGPDATRPEDRYAFSTLAADAVVDDTVRVPRSELGA